MTTTPLEADVPRPEPEPAPCTPPCPHPLQRQEHFRVAFELSPDAISINRMRDCVYVDVNEGFLALTGYGRDDVVGSTPGKIGIWASAADRDLLLGELKRRGEVKNLDVSYRLKDGSVRATLTSVRLVQLDAEPHALTVAHDIHALKQTQLALQRTKTELETANRQLIDANRMLEQLSITDGLTDLYNHRYLMRMLELEHARAVRYRHGMVLLMIDVDHFKRVNDDYGHPCGDEVLRSVARLLKQQARGTDIIARYGGDEFSIIMMEASSANAAKVAEKIRRRIEGFPFQYQGRVLRVTVSIGLAGHPDEKILDWQALLRCADSCLYHAKRNGRNRVTALAPTPAQPSRGAAQLQLFAEPE
jgi:diguanylate cyclase (GGDEF)-like protein/PAS domain S-box-containing protein